MDPKSRETITSFDIYNSRIADSRLWDGARFLVCGERLVQHSHHALAEVITIAWQPGRTGLPPFVTTG